MLFFGAKLATVAIVFAIVCAVVVSQNPLYEGTGDFAFPGPINSRNDGSSDSEPRVSTRTRNDELMKELELARKLSTIETIDEYLKVMGVQTPPVFFSTRLGSAEERSNAIRATAALCTPELQTVRVWEKPNPAYVHFPQCVRIKRCGGCCNHALLSCQPIATEIRNYEIQVAKIGTNQFQSEIVPLEEHTKCKCLCKTKPEDCNAKQIYEQVHCSCICTNLDEEEKCLQDKNKLWDPKDCTCGCRNGPLECSSGLQFDPETCRSAKKTGYTTWQSGRTEHTPPVIIPLDASDPRRKHKDDPEYK